MQNFGMCWRRCCLNEVNDWGLIKCFTRSFQNSLHELEVNTSKSNILKKIHVKYNAAKFYLHFYIFPECCVEIEDEPAA